MKQNQVQGFTTQSGAEAKKQNLFITPPQFGLADLDATFSTVYYASSGTGASAKTFF
jgi:hypothetical protein